MSGIRNLVHKYRVCQLDNIAGQNIVETVKQMADDGNNIPHLLICGPPGTGKTKLAMALMYKLYGEHVNDRCFYYGNEMDRGIDMVRKIISDLLVTKIQRFEGVPHNKFAIIDNADSFGVIGQRPLKMAMEREGTTLRFCIICNNPSFLLLPISSRCFKINMPRLSPTEIFAHLKKIEKIEKTSVGDDRLQEISKTTGGDMRKAILEFSKTLIVQPKDETFVVPTVTKENILQISQKIILYKTRNLIFSDTCENMNEILAEYEEKRVKHNTFIHAYWLLMRLKKNNGEEFTSYRVF